MKKLLLIDMPDGVEFKVESFNYGFFETCNGIERYVSYTIPVEIPQIPTAEEVQEQVYEVIGDDLGGNTHAYIMGANWMKNKILKK